MKCLRCNRPLKNPQETIGKICKRKALAESAESEKQARARLIEKTQFQRVYLVLTEPRYFVRVDLRDDGRFAGCRCPVGSRPGRCEHIDIVAKIDRAKFPDQPSVA